VRPAWISFPSASIRGPAGGGCDAWPGNRPPSSRLCPREQPPFGYRRASRSMTIRKGCLSPPIGVISPAYRPCKAFHCTWTLLMRETASQWHRRPADRCEWLGFLDPPRWAPKDVSAGTGEYAVPLTRLESTSSVPSPGGAAFPGSLNQLWFGVVAG